MSEKRKDNKGRNLRDNEDQEKSGCYRYRYTDRNGNRKVVRSWKLTATDKVPEGKKDGLSLRQKEKQIEHDIMGGLDVVAAETVTLNSMYNKYIGSLTGRKRSTMNGYRFVYDHFVRDMFGDWKIRNVKQSDLKKFYADLLKDGKKIGTIRNIQAVLYPVFAAAVADDIILKNPADGIMKNFRTEKSEKRHALTKEEVRLLCDFMDQSANYGKWKPLFIFLLGTGCRIGEATGLTWADIDYKAETININHNLQYGLNDEGKSFFYINTPKTEAGTREIPLFPEVREALRKQREIYLALGVHSDQVIDGYTDFVFLSRDKRAFDYAAIDKALERIRIRANEWERERAEREHREPLEVRHFSAHNLRHTFCTRLCEQESDLAIIMEIMGHDDVKTTMEIYNELQPDHREKKFAELRKNIKIA